MSNVTIGATGALEKGQAISYDTSGGERKTRTFSGPYATMETLMRQHMAAGCLSATLSPEGPGRARLQVVYGMTPAEGGGSTPDATGVKTTVVSDSEDLSKALEECPGAAGLSTAQIKAVQAAVSESGTNVLVGTLSQAELDLYNRLVKGQTQFNQGVPTISRTRTGLKAEPAAKNTWVRDTPDCGVIPPGTWSFMLVKYTITEDVEAGTWSLEEKWLGAQVWDSYAYPT